MKGECFSGSDYGGKLRPTTSAPKQVEEPKHSSKGLSFIKVLDHDYTKQLQIPQEFTTNFNGYVSHRVIIESTVVKKCWRVEIEEDDDGQMYFRGGWHDFVESLSLEVGNFLIFEYEERSIFHVKVYGRDGCEKTSIHHKLEKTAEYEEHGESEAFRCDEEILGVHHQQKRIRELSPKKDKHGIYIEQRTGVKDYSRTAKASITKNRVRFSVTLHKQKQHQFMQLNIPKAVSLRKLGNKERVMLQTAKGSCWPVKVAHRRDGQVVFSQGWKDFMKENEFAAGDILNFEFISDNVIQVGATKTTQVHHCSEEPKYQNKASYMDDKQSIYKKQHAFDKKKTKTVKVSISKDSVRFSVTLHRQKNHQFVQLTVPKEVSVRKELWNKEKVMLQDVQGNCWPVKVAHRRDGRGIFSRGWKHFMKENEFAAGDTLNFEFISDYVIEVRAIRASQVEHYSEEARYENEASNMDCEPGEVGEDDEPDTCTLDVKANEDSIATKGVSSRLKSSTFSLTWKKTTAGTYLNIPKAVAQDQNLMNKETVVFRDPEGKCWPLQVRTWWDGRIMLTKGWVEFWEGHAVSAGDFLHFEFVSNCLIQVTIKRGSPTLKPATEVLDGDLPEAIDNEVAALSQPAAAR